VAVAARVGEGAGAQSGSAPVSGRFTPHNEVRDS